MLKTTKTYTEEGLKICSSCKVPQAIDNYSSNRSKHDGLSNVCKACNKAGGLAYRKNNPEKMVAMRRAQYLKNMDKEKARDAVYKAKRRTSDPSFKLLRSLRDRHYKAVKAAGKNKTFRTTILLGCSAEYLKQHIENQFSDGMTWDNHGVVWHIDHIVPLSKVNWEDSDSYAKACHYTNLQPLFALDNIRKGNR